MKPSRLIFLPAFFVAAVFMNAQQPVIPVTDNLVVEGIPSLPSLLVDEVKAYTESRGLMAKDEGHGFRKKNNADYQFYSTIAFVKQYLLD